MQLFSIALPVSELKANLLDMVDRILEDDKIKFFTPLVNELKSKANDWNINQYTDQEYALLFPTNYNDEFIKIVNDHEEGTAWSYLPHVVYDSEYLVFAGFDNCFIPLIWAAGGNLVLGMEFFRDEDVVHIKPRTLTGNEGYSAMVNKFEVTDAFRKVAPEFTKAFSDMVEKQKRVGLSATPETFFATGSAC